jgi:energy-coupling factor transport system substrate-specific component
MRDVFAMWRNTRMVVLTAMTASLYAAILIPFKVLPLIPGVTEFRPANAVPVVCSFLFGPAAAWGAAIGNVIGDFFGGMGPGDLFGFVGNFFYGLLPYKAWRALTDADPLPRSALQWIAFVAIVVLAAGACAVTIGWGLNLLGFVPFSILGNVILLNNGVVAVLLSPLLLFTIYPRVKRARLRYDDIMPAATAGQRRITRRFGLLVVAAAVAGGMVAGNLLSVDRIDVPFVADEAGGTRAAHVGLGLLPIVLLILLGAALL